MTYIINPMWFYLISLSDNLKTCCGLLAGISAIFALILFVSYYDEDLPTLSYAKKCGITAITLLFLTVLLPTKETCYQMAVASCVTTENLTTAEEEIKDIVDYIADKFDD